MSCFTPNRTTAPRRLEAGTTLVELMIALVVSSLAVAAAIGISYTVQGNFADHRRTIRVASTGRIALDVMVQALQAASPGLGSGVVWDPCTGANIDTIIATNQTDGPDSIEIVYASGGALASITSGQTLFAGGQITVDDTADFEEDMWTPAVIVDPFNGKGHLIEVQPDSAGPTFMNVRRPGDCTTAGDGDTAYPAASYVIRSRRVAFTVDPPYLFMDPDGPGDEDPQPIGEGIEDMQIAYAVDLDDDGNLLEGPSTSDEIFYNVDGDAAVPSVSLGQWRAVRVTLSSRSVDDVGQAGVSSRRDAEDRVGGTQDSFKRRSYTTLVTLRNFRDGN